MSEQFITSKFGDVNLHICSTPKFKTNAVSVMFRQQLDSRYVTRHALLPAVLQQGTSTAPSHLKIKRRLEDLFGAHLFGFVYKSGSSHIAQFGVEMPNQKYLSDASNLLEDAVGLLADVIMKPYLENGYFSNEYVDNEKRLLRQKIESMRDDKKSFSYHRLIEEMYAGNPYSLLNYGSTQDLDVITPVDLYKYYHDMLRQCPVDVYFIGDVPIEEARESLSGLAQQLSDYGARRHQMISDNPDDSVKQVREVVEKMDISQGKLNMGCRTHILPADQNYPALLMYNGVLGGFSHSKLFMNVREKHSLAYYASSGLDSPKGLMIISSGIDSGNYDKAVKIIKEQMQSMKEGKISDRELSHTLATLVNQLKEQQDNNFSLIDYNYRAILSDNTRSRDRLIEEIQNVTREDIVDVAKKVDLDTIYFLRSNQGA